MEIDEQKVEEAVGKVFGELATAVTGPLILLGDRLGLWAALAGAGPVTPDQLAARTGTVERYVREWLCGVAVAGRLEDNFASPYARVGYAISTLVCTPSSLAQPGAAALGAMAGEARLRQVLTEAGYPNVRRVAQQTAPFNIVLEARP
jgi:hypothetical protein